MLSSRGLLIFVAVLLAVALVLPVVAQDQGSDAPPGDDTVQTSDDPGGVPDNQVVPTDVPPPTVQVAPTATPVRATPTPSREQLVSFPSGDLTLGGWMWKPAGAGPFPAVLYNHGSEKLPGAKPEVARVFLQQGYVVFVPHRRGQGRSPGPYIQDQIQQAAPFDRNRLQVELLEAQVADQLAGLNYMRSLSYVDSGRIAVAGCSYGGIQTVLGAEANPGYRVAVDFAGAAQSWQGNPILQQRLIRAMQGITIPMFLLQAENDYDLAPTNTLSAELTRLGKPFQAKIYPPFGTTHEEGHGGFCEGGGTNIWGPDVLQFVGAGLGS
jgi:carboxymethylenebutenolidase